VVADGLSVCGGSGVTHLSCAGIGVLYRHLDAASAMPYANIISSAGEFVTPI
jgi:hypothetical protein